MLVGCCLAAAFASSSASIRSSSARLGSRQFRGMTYFSPRGPFPRLYFTVAVLSPNAHNPRVSREVFAFPKTASSRCNISANTERRCLGDRPDFTLFPVQTHGQKPFPALGTGQAGFPLSCVWWVCVRRPVPAVRSPRRSPCRLLMDRTGPLQSPGCLGSAGLVSGNVHLGSARFRAAGASVPDDFLVQSSLGLGR